MVDKKTNFNLFFPENLKKDSNISTTEKLSFDSLADFLEEREKIQRQLESNLKTKLRVDYSDFANHVFFDSAATKYAIAQDRILLKYPYNGTELQKDRFFLTSSDYENYLFNIWPRSVGYVNLSGTNNQYISSSDTDNKLLLSTASLYVSTWIEPNIVDQNIILQKVYKNSNLVIFSEEFTSSEWLKTRTSISASVGENTQPSVLKTSASILVEDSTAANTHHLTDTISLTSGKRYRYSVVVKAINRNNVYLQSTASPTPIASFILDSGSLFSTVNTTNTGIDVLNNGWYRLWYTWLQTSTASSLVQLYIADPSNSVVVNGLSQEAFYIGSIQLEEEHDERFDVIYLYTSGSESTIKTGYDLYLSGSSDSYIKFSIYSGTSETSVSAAYNDYIGNFNNVGAIYDNVENLLSLYINKDKKASSSISYNSFEHPPGVVLIGSGSKFSANDSFDFYTGSLNEVRILHTASQLFHEKNFNRPIHAENYVKLHYKFNEGITTTSSIDEIIVDYSKNGLHGYFHNYENFSRVSASVLLEDTGDPILYNFHPNVINFSSSLVLSASLYDKQNNNFIFNFIPSDVLIEDELEEGLLKSLTLSMARYFDEIKLYIDQFDNLKITNYDGVNETPDVFLPFLKKYFGWKITEHFEDASPLPFFFGEKVLSTGSLSTPLIDVRNQFWRRILNNLPYLMKTKGKRHSLDAYFNVVGINKENLNFKEFGYLPGGSIQDDRIEKKKIAPRIGIGTGSTGIITGSFIQTPLFYNYTGGDFTVEAQCQLPFASASYTNTLLSGNIWTLVSGTTWIACGFARDSLESEFGKIFLSSSAGSKYFTDSIQIFNGEFTTLALGNNINNLPFAKINQLETCDIVLSASLTGSSFTFPSANYRLIMGANSGSSVGLELGTQGFFGEYRVWDRELSGSEVNDHTLHFESIGTLDPISDNNFLKGHWAFNKEITSDSTGRISGIDDLSRNNNIATGSDFSANENVYRKFLLDFNPLSPSIDLKWTENKIRIRNKTELKFNDNAYDTNEVSLEFNLVDALNEDISKIFSTFDEINNVIGHPVNKYRDEYQDLEGIRRKYFERLGTSIHFSKFFDLFEWFDKKISNAIKQLLPIGARFIGGEQVVESHFLERSKYGYKYPIFRTPQSIPEIGVNTSGVLNSSMLKTYSNSESAKGAYAKTLYEKNLSFEPYIKPKDSLLTIEANKSTEFVSSFNEGLVIQNKRARFLRNWKTINTLDLGGASASWNDIYVDKTNRILYVAGYAQDDSDVYHWVVDKSIDQGLNWSRIDNMTGALANTDAKANAIIKSGSDIYVVGTRFDEINGHNWYVKRSSDEGVSWSVLENVDFNIDTPSSSYGEAKDISISDLGAIYVCGVAKGSSSLVFSGTWIVRKSETGNSGTWSTIDSFTSGSLFGAEAICIAASGTVVCTGGHVKLGTVFPPIVGNTYTIKVSNDSGSTWDVVQHDYNLDVDENSFASLNNLKINNDGIIFSSGRTGRDIASYIKVAHITASTDSDWTSLYDANSIPRVRNIGNIVKVFSSVDQENLFYSVGTNNNYNLVVVKNFANVYGDFLTGSEEEFVVTEQSAFYDVEILRSDDKNFSEDVIYAIGSGNFNGNFHGIVVARYPEYKFLKLNQVNGNTKYNVFESNTSINLRNEFAKKILTNKLRDNEE